MKILIIEDELALGKSIAAYLAGGKLHLRAGARP